MRTIITSTAEVSLLCGFCMESRMESYENS